MTGHEAARARECNLEAWRAVAKATGRDLIDANGMLTYFSMAPAGNFNPTIVYEPLEDPSDLLVVRAAEYESRGIPFGFEIPAGLDERVEAAAIERGLVLRDEQPAMVLHPIGSLPEPDARARRVTPDVLDEHLVAQADGFGDPIEALRVFTPPSMLNAAAMFTVYEDGAAAATALTCVTESGAGVFGVAVREPMRRRGLGTVATLAAVRAAAAGGADFVFLHASKMGKPVYERLGFRIVDAVRIYAFAG